MNMYILYPFEWLHIPCTHLLFRGKSKQSCQIVRFVFFNCSINKMSYEASRVKLQLHIIINWVKFSCKIVIWHFHPFGTHVISNVSKLILSILLCILNHKLLFYKSPQLFCFSSDVWTKWARSVYRQDPAQQPDQGFPRICGQGCFREEDSPWCLHPRRFCIHFRSVQNFTFKLKNPSLNRIEKS